MLIRDTQIVPKLYMLISEQIRKTRVYDLEPDPPSLWYFALSNLSCYSIAVSPSNPLFGSRHTSTSSVILYALLQNNQSKFFIGCAIFLSTQVLFLEVRCAPFSYLPWPQTLHFLEPRVPQHSSDGDEYPSDCFKSRQDQPTAQLRYRSL
jgi:hypothetical protein